ncbi:MAG: 4Fe-4S binding protein [Opitutales bacterium]
MNIKEIYEYAHKIGALTFSTIYKDEVHSRIAHFNGYDDEGIYFRTMANKPYGKQLKSTKKVTVCGNFGGEILNKDDIGAIPDFATGYSFRLIGDIRKVTAEEIIEKAKTNKFLELAKKDIENYPQMADGNYIIYKAKGEIFNYDFSKKLSPYKLNRQRFAFGGASVNPCGVKITDDCISCGRCEEVCSFSAIEYAGSKYEVNPAHCDDCGSCMLECPVGAIIESQPI